MASPHRVPRRPAVGDEYVLGSVGDPDGGETVVHALLRKGPSAGWMARRPKRI
jgi:hypothetical protein